MKFYLTIFHQFASKLLLLVLLLFSATSSLGRTEPEPKPMIKARLIMGFYAHSITEMASLSDIEVSLNFWVKDFMVEELWKVGIDVSESHAVLFDSISEMREAALKGELDMVIAPPLLLVLNFKRSELEDGFTGMLAGNRPDDLLFITHTDKHIKGVQDLQGKRLALPNNDEFAAMYLDSLFLQHFRKPVQQVVASIEKQNKANRIVLDIYFNKADAGMVYRNAYEVMAELNPDIAKKVVIISQYPIKSRNFSYFLHGYPLSKTITDHAIQQFKASVRGKQIMEVFKTPDLASCTVNELDAYEDFYHRYQALKSQVKP